MEHTNWVNILLIARTVDAKNQRTFLHKFTIPFGPGNDGVWWRITVPLAEFQRQTAKGFEDIPPGDEELFFGATFSAPPPDRGLVIDEFTIRRGGPGKYVYERLK